MAMQYTRGYCHDCERNVRAERKGPPHALMLMVVVLSCGLLLPLYLLESAGYKATAPYRCQRCDAKVAPNSERDLEPPRKGRIRRTYEAANAASDAWGWLSWLFK